MMKKTLQSIVFSLALAYSALPGAGCVIKTTVKEKPVPYLTVVQTEKQPKIKPTHSKIINGIKAIIPTTTQKRAIKSSVDMNIFSPDLNIISFIIFILAQSVNCVSLEDH